MLSEFPPENLDDKESWDEYKKRIKNKYGDKYDLFFKQIEGFSQALVDNSIAYMELSLEEKIEYLGMTRGNEKKIESLRKELELQNISYLKCPHCGYPVLDKRFNKTKRRSPDFICTNNNPNSCSGHNGWDKKAWWMNSNDLPERWRKKKKSKKDVYSGGVVDDEGYFDQERYDALKAAAPCNHCGRFKCEHKNNI